MAVVILDAGNTCVKMVRWLDAVSYPDFLSGGFMAEEICEAPSEIQFLSTKLHQENPKEFLTKLSQWNDVADDPVVLVSVIPEIEKLFSQVWPQLKVVGHAHNLPFQTEILQPETVGPDRFCNIACALASGLTDALVVDAGTAITFDLLLEGVFKGGLIAPGMEFSARKLARHGAMLSPVPFEARPAEVGLNTVEAMMTGAWLTGVGGVEWTISRLLETYGPVPVILTGGSAVNLAHDGRYYDPYWTLRGAAYLAGYQNSGE